MTLKNIEIAGMGFCHPSGRITNQFLEDLKIESSAQWVLEKIGIEERRTVLPLDYIVETKNKNSLQSLSLMEMTPVDMAEKAALMAIERAGIKTSDIGMILCNCCTPMDTAPSEGVKLARRLKISVPTQDVFTACPVFALHVDFINKQKRENLPDYILCVSTATLTQRVDYTNRSDSAIWGDGAAAWIISTRKEGLLKVLHSSYSTDPVRCQAVIVETTGHFHQDGRAVRDFSVRQTVRMIKQLEDEHGVDWSKDTFIGHQANGTMLEQICNNRNIPALSHWHNVRFIGNQAGAGAPAVLAQHWEQIKPKQKIVVAVLGAGLSWGSILLEAH
jgi:3-oxoacyl-[acyl-carrier-protein] synthase-3